MITFETNNGVRVDVQRTGTIAQAQKAAAKKLRQLGALKFGELPSLVVGKSGTGQS